MTGNQKPQKPAKVGRDILKARNVPLSVMIALGLSGGVAFPSPTLCQSLHSAHNDTLAIIGTRVITAIQFAKSYRDELRTTGLTDNLQSREGYLNNLVDDEVLIARARFEELDRTPGAAAELQRIRMQELLNAYSDEHISPTIQVSEHDLQDLFVRMNTRVKVRHLYAASRHAADSLHYELLQGKTFEELARGVFTDPKLRDGGGSLGYIGFDEMDPAFENAAFAMNIGQVSTPVKTAEGYSIIRVDDIQRNPLVTRNEFDKARDRLRRFVRKRKYEEAVTQFTSRERTLLQIRFNDPLINRIFSLLRRDGNNGVREDGFSESELRQTAVTSKAGRWTARKVLEELKTSDDTQRRWIRSEENLTDFIAGLIIREKIAALARNERLDTCPSYDDEVSYTFETYLATSLENRLKSQIRFSQDSLLSYYHHNPGRFVRKAQIRLSAILLDSAAIADSVQHMLERGIPFPDLATRFSIQRITADRGGDIGYYTEEQLDNLQAGVSRITAGQWAGPITQDGKYLFVMCTERKASQQKSFDESTAEITEILLETSWQSERARWVESFKKSVRCQIYPERLMLVSLESPTS